MGLMDVAKSALGITEKAKLFVHEIYGAEKLDSRDVGEASLLMLAGAVGSLFGGTSIKSHEMTVQYNPSSLTIQANAKSIPFTYLQQNLDNGVPNQNIRPPMVVLSVELVFDEMNPQDAFLMDRTRLSVGSVVSNVAAVMKLFDGGYTVQPKTNGLLATVLKPNTKVVTFRWADMAFTGQVVEAQAQYTMFSPSGKPVRSVVKLNIAQQVESEADTEYWEKAMDDVFNSGGGGLLGAVKNATGNVLNLDAF